MATPLTATPIPAYTALPDVPADLTAALNNLEKFTIPRFATTTARDTAIAAPVDGQMAYITGTHTLYEYNNGSWISVVGALPVTSSTRPAAPWVGCEIYETDTLNLYIWSGSAWLFEGSLSRAPYAMSVGTTAFTMSGVGTVNVTASFPAGRFSVAPIVTASVGVATNSEKVIVRPTNVTTTSVDLNVSNQDYPTTITVTGGVVYWHAVQMTPTTAAG